MIALLPVMAASIVGNNEIFNAYLVWAERSADLRVFGQPILTEWLVSVDAIVSVATLFGMVLFWRVWKTRYKEPWMTQNAISTYGDMWVIKDALEKAGKADRVAVGEALRTMDDGPSKYYPLGEIKFDEKGRRVGAGMTIVQWQSGVPVTVFPPELALAQPSWPKS